jgi:YebC/PmpR family DNA-binding regulatory protein
MAGHSKWAQIKRTKAVVDAKRGALFTKLGREIMVAARGGADPAGNFQLRTAIEKGKAAGLPNANIERAIAKGAGQLAGEGSTFEEVRYEGYGPGGVAVLVEAFTDNRNRTAADLRLAFSKHGGNLGETGCVGYLFEQRSVVRLGGAGGPGSAEPLAEEPLLEALLALGEAGGPAVLGYELLAEDGEAGAGVSAGASAEVFAAFADLEALQDGLRLQGLAVTSWEHRWIPQTLCPLSDPEALRRCLRMLDALDDLDDVRSVTSNLEADEGLIEVALAV